MVLAPTESVGEGIAFRTRNVAGHVPPQPHFDEQPRSEVTVTRKWWTSELLLSTSRLGLPALASDSCLRRHPVPRLAPVLLEHADLAHHHAAVRGLAHVVDGEQADLHRGQRFHLDAGA